MEDKGILLGMMYYILKKRNSFKKNKTNIIIDNKKFRQILAVLFYDLEFRRTGKGFQINIKNNKQTDLVINNINNLDKIKTNKAYLLQWYDDSNPIIMYRVSDKKFDLDELKKKIKRFSRWKRYVNYGPKNYVTDVCYIDGFWDTAREYYVLDRYVNVYQTFSIKKIYEFITYALMHKICYARRVYVPYPVGIPIYRESKDINKEYHINLINSIAEKLRATNQVLAIK